MRPPLSERESSPEARAARARARVCRQLAIPAAAEEASEEAPEATALLKAALEDGWPEVRRAAAWAVARRRRAGEQGLLHWALLDEDAEVRLWAAAGLARQGDGAACRWLVTVLEEGPPALRPLAGQALVEAGADPAARAALHTLLSRGAPEVRTWSAAVLAGLGHRQAEAAWRQGLGSAATRVDAALAAPLVRSLAAARALLEEAAGLSETALAAPAGGGLSLAALLTAPLEALGLEELGAAVQAEPPLRATVLRVLARAPGAWPPVRTALLHRVWALPQAGVGRELAALATDAGPVEGLCLLGALALLLPGAVQRALQLLPSAWHEALRAAARADGRWAPLRGLLEPPAAPDGGAEE